MTTAIAARGLFAGYHGVPAVHGLDLEVDEGEVVLLGGPNGAGKSTTLMTLAGALPPLGGRVEQYGKETKAPLFRRVRGDLGLITEARTVFMNLTVGENLRLGRGRVEDGLAHFPELEKRLKVKAGLCSGGEQQMLSVGRVLAARPRIILADELSLGLAPIVVKRLHAALREAANGGAAVLLVEQHVKAALEVVDRGYFLKRGHLEYSGDRDTLAADEGQLEQLYL